ncbi:MAG: hypothetical protein BWY77_01432 [bacterium ADurb.Bin431]|nr:MAG: hypothetical protein BWY77_01432 [bacterium ADurb.Bin431]
MDEIEAELEIAVGHNADQSLFQGQGILDEKEHQEGDGDQGEDDADEITDDKVDDPFAERGLELGQLDLEVDIPETEPAHLGAHHLLEIGKGEVGFGGAFAAAHSHHLCLEGRDHGDDADDDEGGHGQQDNGGRGCARDPARLHTDDQGVEDIGEEEGDDQHLGDAADGAEENDQHQGGEQEQHLAGAGIAKGDHAGFSCLGACRICWRASLKS